MSKQNHAPLFSYGAAAGDQCNMYRRWSLWFESRHMIPRRKVHLNLTELKRC